MLQRAWNHDPQSLPFAPYIRTHALVSLVQKGLQYHELEQSFDKVLDFLSFISSPIFFFLIFFFMSNYPAGREPDPVHSCQLFLWTAIVGFFARSTIRWPR